MSDTILSGNFTVYYLDDDRRKQIRWTGTTAKDDTEKMIDVYDAAEDLMTLPTQMDDGLIFSAETPGEYTIGIIDSGDLEPWFIDLKSMEHIVGDYANFTGCALKTSGWARSMPADGSGNIGIVVVPITNVDIDSGDIGDTISHGDGDSGTLLDFVDTGGGTDYLFIRPDTNTLGDDFNSSSGTLTMGTSANTATQTAAAHTGEMVWGNVYTQGALVTDTHIYIYQDGERVTISDDSDNDWWVDGHMDRSVPIKDYTTDAFPTIDAGYLTVKANQYGSKYTYAIIRMNTTSGGNVSAGLSSGDDITNTTGYKSITISGGTGNWTVGDEISGDTSGARAIITQIDNPGATATLHYFLIGDPLTDFNGSEAISNEDDTGAATGSGAVSDQGPALAGWFDNSVAPTVTFANNQEDVDDDTVDEEYAITIDMNQATLAEMHEWAKYLHMRGSTTDQDGLDGQEWIGIDYAINYASITGTVPEGSVVTGATSGATGTIVSNPGGTSNVALLRDSRGTFQDGERIYETDGVNEFDASGLTVEVIVPVAASSFGTLAGTTYFGSRGVLLTDYKTTEANNFSLIDATGTGRARPTVITMSILNLKQYDWATCYRLLGSGLAIEKDEFTCTGGESIGDATLDTDSTIPADVPGKTAGGSLVLVDVTDSYKEYVIRYSAYDASTGEFTLANSVWTAEALTDTDTIIDTGAFANTKVGDLVYNNDLTEISYVTEVVSDDEISIYPPLTGQDVADTGEINCVPIVPTSSDKVYVPIVFEFQESNGSTSSEMQYISDIYSVVRVRNTSDAATKIKGFTAAVTIGTGGGTSSATRIENTVYGS